jgi:hypothetical protein
MRCENDDNHNPENFCPTCSTCHDCIAESDENNAATIKRLKAELQKAINERNEAWFQLEENSIDIREPVPEE